MAENCRISRPSLCQSDIGVSKTVFTVYALGHENFMDAAAQFLLNCERRRIRNSTIEEQNSSMPRNLEEIFEKRGENFA